MNNLIALLIACGLVYAQDGATVIIGKGPQNYPYQRIYGYSGSNLVYICKARAVSNSRASTSISITAATNANPVVLTSVGHGFHANSRPSITISGGTGNWTAINGTFAATILSADTFSIAVNSTSIGALAGTIKFTTTAPRTTVAEWEVEVFAYDGSGNMIWGGYLNGRSSSQKCSEAALTTTNWQ